VQRALLAEFDAGKLAREDLFERGTALVQERIKSSGGVKP
jgi:hypothetical protein